MNQAENFCRSYPFLLLLRRQEKNNKLLATFFPYTIEFLRFKSFKSFRLNQFAKIYLSSFKWRAKREKDNNDESGLITCNTRNLVNLCISVKFNVFETLFSENILNCSISVTSVIFYSITYSEMIKRISLNFFIYASLALFFFYVSIRLEDIFFIPCWANTCGWLEFLRN